MARLRRGETLRCPGSGDRRSPLPGPVHRVCLHRHSGRHSTGAPMRGRSHGTCRCGPGKPRCQIAAIHPRGLPARRVVPDRRRHPVPPCGRHPAPAGAPAHTRVPAPGPIWPFHLGPGVRATRPLQHRTACQGGRGTDGRTQRAVGRVHTDADRQPAGPYSLRGACPGRRPPAHQHRHPGSPHRTPGTTLGGRMHQPDVAGPRRGARSAAGAPVCAGVPDVLPRKLPCGGRRRGRRHPCGAERASAPGGQAVPATERRRWHPAFQDLQHRQGRLVRFLAGAGEHGCAGAGRTPLPHRQRQLLDPRPRTAGAARHGTVAHHGAFRRPVHAGLAWPGGK